MERVKLEEAWARRFLSESPWPCFRESVDWLVWFSNLAASMTLVAEGCSHMSLGYLDADQVAAPALATSLQAAGPLHWAYGRSTNACFVESISPAIYPQNLPDAPCLTTTGDIDAPSKRERSEPDSTTPAKNGGGQKFTKHTQETKDRMRQDKSARIEIARGLAAERGIEFKQLFKARKGEYKHFWKEVAERRGSNQHRAAFATSSSP